MGKRSYIALILVVFGFACVLLPISRVHAAGAQLTQESVTAAATSFGTSSQYPDGIITDFTTNIILDNKGNATIEEKIIVYFPSQRHGIYRFIPNESILDSGKRLKQPITIKSVSYRRLSNTLGAQSTSTLSQYSKSRSGGNYTFLKIGDPDVYISGAYEYTIKYAMKRAIRFQDGYQELYLNITGDQWELPILKASATVTPGTNVQETRCYTGVTGSTATNCASETIGSNYAFKTTTPATVLAQGLTIAMKYQDNTFTPPTQAELLVEMLAPFAPLLIPVVVFLFGFLTWQKHGRDTPLFAIPPQFVPTAQMEKESLSILNSLLIMKGLPVATTAELIRLAEKGYLVLNYEKGKASIELTPKQQEELPKYLEAQPASLRTMIETLTRTYQPSTTINALSNVHTKIAEATKQAQAEFKETPYIADSSENFQGSFTAFSVIFFIGAFILFGVMSESTNQYWALWPVSLIISGIFLGIFAAGMLKRTKEGQSVYLDLHGLKKYIKTAEVKRLEFFNNPKRMIAHFEQILPYAVILKLDKQWTKEFGPILEQLQYAPAWLVSDMPIHNALPRVYASMSNQISSSMAKISTPPHSSGSSFGGGGGGFSGGGSGGGGGGSW